MELDVRELSEKVDELIRENGKWLEEEGSVNIYEYKLNKDDVLIIQLHSTLEKNVYKPIFRIYSIENNDVNYEKFSDNIEEAIEFFNGAKNRYVSK